MHTIHTCTQYTHAHNTHMHKIHTHTQDTHLVEMSMGYDKVDGSWSNPKRVE